MGLVRSTAFSKELKKIQTTQSSKQASLENVKLMAGRETVDAHSWHAQ